MKPTIIIKKNPPKLKYEFVEDKLIVSTGRKKMAFNLFKPPLEPVVEIEAEEKPCRCLIC